MKTSQQLLIRSTSTDKHGNWSYDTVIAEATDELVAHELNDESHEVRWVLFDDVTRLPLHPSFAKSWHDLRAHLDYLITPR